MPLMMAARIKNNEMGVVEILTHERPGGGIS